MAYVEHLYVDMNFEKGFFFGQSDVFINPRLTRTGAWAYLCVQKFNDKNETFTLPVPSASSTQEYVTD